MCANWIVSVGKVGGGSAGGSSKVNVTPSHFHVASDSSLGGPQWRFVAKGGRAAAAIQGANESWQAKHVLQGVLSKLVDKD